MFGSPSVHRHGLRPADERQLAHDRDEREDDRPEQVGVHYGVQRHAAEQARRRIAQPIGRPRMRAFVHGQGKQQNDEGYEDLSDVDVEQGVFRLRPTRKKRKNGVGQFRADSGGQFFAAPDARKLQTVYANLSTRLAHVKEKRQVTSAFAGGALVLLLAGAGFGIARGGRLP